MKTRARNRPWPSTRCCSRLAEMNDAQNLIDAQQRHVRTPLPRLPSLMRYISIRRRDAVFLPDCARVLLRPFIPADRQRLTSIIGRALAMTEEEAEHELAAVRHAFSARRPRHRTVAARAFFTRSEAHGMSSPIARSPRSRQLLIGALFTGEYALESARRCSIPRSCRIPIKAAFRPARFVSS